MSCGATSCSTSPGYYFPADVRTERFAPWLIQIATTVHRALDRQRQRKALLELDDRLLDDVGLSKAHALEEGRKPFWR